MKAVSQRSNKLRLLQLPPPQIVALCVALVIAIGVADYLTGYELSISVAYLLPIGLATWSGGWRLGILFSLLGTGTSIFTDLLSGIPAVRLWDEATAFVGYAVFTWVLANWRRLVKELDQRIRDRTAALEREIHERELLEREIASVTERERRRLGQDLHDTLCQHLAGTSLMAQALAEKLGEQGSREAKEAREVVRLIESGADMSHDLARGLFSHELEAEGLPLALKALASENSARHNIECIFDSNTDLAVQDSQVATALYRIAREAVTNAVKHAHAHQVVIRLSSESNKLALTVSDDGIGISNAQNGRDGLGMRMMAHSAAVVGGDFKIRAGAQGGTTLSCTVPVVEVTN